MLISPSEVARQLGIGDREQRLVELPNLKVQRRDGGGQLAPVAAGAGGRLELFRQKRISIRRGANLLGLTSRWVAKPSRPTTAVVRERRDSTKQPCRALWKISRSVT
jgi:hypothetical protein